MSIHVQHKFFWNTLYSSEEKLTVKECSFHTSFSCKPNKACAWMPTYHSKSIIDEQNTILCC